MTTRTEVGIALDHGRTTAVESLIGLAQSQIAAGMARAANIDAQALGLIGLDAGLIAVAVAAQGLLGPNWWVAIPGLVVSIAIGGAALAITRFDLGPEPEKLYGQIEAKALSGEETIARLLADLVETYRANREPLRSKATRLLIAVGVLVTTIVYATLVIML